MTYTINRRRLFGAGLAVFAGTLLGHRKLAGSATQTERIVKISTKRFEFSPRVITLKMGEPVTFEFSALDITMGFKMPDFDVRADVIPGKTTRLRFLPTKSGTFVFLCDIFCGEGHENMTGKLVVVE